MTIVRPAQSWALDLPVSLPTKLGVTSAQMEHMPVYLRVFFRVLSSWVHCVMSHDIVPTCVATSFHVSGSAAGLVVPARVEGEFSDQLAVFGEHTDPQAVDEHQDPRAPARRAPAGETGLSRRIIVHPLASLLSDGRQRDPGSDGSDRLGT